MKNAFLVHSAEGNPQENWLPWLSAELENLGYKVVAPQFPTPEGQSLSNWLNVLKPHMEEFNSETIIVGHSIGVAFVLNVLEKLNTKINAAFLVAGFIRDGGDEYDKINQTFYDHPFDWDKIKSNPKNIFCFASDNDPNVPLWQAQEVADNLGTKLTMVSNAGHFTAGAGYTQFPLLLEKIKSN